MKLQKPSALVRIFSILLGILLVFTLLISGILGILRSSLSAEGIRNSVGKVDITDIRIPSKTPGGSSGSSGNANGSTSGDGTVSISEYLIDQLGDEVADKYHLTPSRVDALLEKSSVSEFLGDVVARYTSGLVDGSPIDELTADEVVNFIRDNADLIESELGYTLTSEDYSALRNIVAENLDEYLGFLGLDSQSRTAAFGAQPEIYLMARPAAAAAASSDSELNEVLSIVRSVLSDATMWICVGVCALLLGLIVVLNLRSALCGLRVIYVVMFVTAFLFALISAAIIFLPSLLDQPQVAAILSTARGTSLLYCGIYLLIGALALVCCILLKRRAGAKV